MNIPCGPASRAPRFFLHHSFYIVVPSPPSAVYTAKPRRSSTKTRWSNGGTSSFNLADGENRKRERLVDKKQSHRSAGLSALIGRIAKHAELRRHFYNYDLAIDNSESNSRIGHQTQRPNGFVSQSLDQRWWHTIFRKLLGESLRDLSVFDSFQICRRSLICNRRMYNHLPQDCVLTLVFVLGNQTFVIRIEFDDSKDWENFYFIEVAPTYFKNRVLVAGYKQSSLRVACWGCGHRKQQNTKKSKVLKVGRPSQNHLNFSLR